MVWVLIFRMACTRLGLFLGGVRAGLCFFGGFGRRWIGLGGLLGVWRISGGLSS